MKTNGGYVTAEQGKELERQRMEKMREIDGRVEKVAAKLKEDGYRFGIEKTPTQFIISMNGVAHHLMKMDKIPICKEDEDGKTITDNPTIETVIKAIIINPNGSIYDTIHSPEFKNNRSKSANGPVV